MEVIPSIDLKGGRCVRLYQGDYKRETVFSDDPVGTARQWESLGAPRLHLIDLDGAAKGEPCHLKAISEIAGALKIPVQVGGGIRQIEVIRRLLKKGVQRVILGTVAVENPVLVKEACQQYGEAIIIGIDAREGYVATQGWQKKTTITALALIPFQAQASEFVLAFTIGGLGCSAFFPLLIAMIILDIRSLGVVKTSHDSMIPYMEAACGYMVASYTLGLGVIALEKEVMEQFAADVLLVNFKVGIVFAVAMLGLVFYLARTSPQKEV